MAVDGQRARRRQPNAFTQPQPELHDGWVSQTVDWSTQRRKGTSVGPGSVASSVAGRSMARSAAPRAGGRPTRAPPHAPYRPIGSASSVAGSSVAGSTFAGSIAGSHFASVSQFGSQSQLGSSQYRAPSAASSRSPGRTARAPHMSTIGSMVGSSSAAALGSSAASTASSRVSRSTRASRARKNNNPEYAKQRRELDEMMDLVLKLQDQGRFGEVGPYMKRIETLQNRIENTFEEDHVAVTGVAPPKPEAKPLGPRPVRRERGAPGAGKLAAPGPQQQQQQQASPSTSAASTAASSSAQQQQQQQQQQQPSTAIPQQQPQDAPPPPAAATSSAAGAGSAMPITRGPAAGGKVRGQQIGAHQPAMPGLAQSEGLAALRNANNLQASSSSSSSSDDSSDGEDDEGTSESESGRRGQLPRVNENKPLRAGAPTGVSEGNTATRGKGRRYSLSKQVSDCLLLVGPEEESEIIKTLAGGGGGGGTPSGGRPTAAQSAETTVSAATPGVFTTRKARTAKTKPEKERFMLTMQGYMYKAPPEHKRFSRWRNRYFTLAGPLLSYRRGETRSTSRIIDLRGASAEAVILDSSKSRKGRFEVRVKPKSSKRVYRLRVKSKRQALEWYLAVLNNIKVADKEGDVARMEKRRREKLQSKQQSAKGWVPPSERSRVGEDITKEDEDEDLYTHYKVLGVPITASASVIKKKYRELARMYHPDKSKEADISRFAEIGRAFATLEFAESRSAYDLCERVKALFRKGVLFKMHEEDKPPYEVVMFIDSEYKLMFWQDPGYGTVLHASHKVVHIRFIQEILAGSDGFDCPPGRADCCLTMRGARLGCTLGQTKMCNINLEVEHRKARNDILDGLRILRCRFSELFKQRLEQLQEEGRR